MASPLKRLLTSSILLTRTVVPLHRQPVATRVVPSRIRSRGITTFNCLDSNGLVTLSRILDLTPIPSISCSISKEKTNKCEYFDFSINMPGVEEMKETDEGLNVALKIPGHIKEVVNAYIQHDKLLIIGTEPEKLYGMCTIIKLPENINTTSDDITGEIQDGMLNVTLPVNKELKTNGFDFANSSRLAAKSFSDAFNPSKAGRILMSLILGILPSTINTRSFTMYMKKTSESLRVTVNFPGRPGDILEAMREGVCVSINMPGLKIEDVKSSAEYNTFFVEGKIKNERYIYSVDLQEFNVKADDMKEEMQDGMYKVTLPWVDVKDLKWSSELVVIKINRNQEN